MGLLVLVGCGVGWQHGHRPPQGWLGGRRAFCRLRRPAKVRRFGLLEGGGGLPGPLVGFGWVRGRGSWGGLKALACLSILVHLPVSWVWHYLRMVTGGGVEGSGL